MHILITAGGTIVKIDDVRHIGNFSSGSFSAKIANAALLKDHEVIYLHAKNAILPKIKRKLKLVVYETYDDYVRELKNILNNNKIDVVFFAAAVSDYGLKQYQGKISSTKSLLTIKLSRLPKVIKLVKQWSKTPIFQVGFKLLSGVTEENLIEAAYKSGLENKSDLTIANEFSNVRSKKRETIFVTPERGVIKLTEPNLAKKIIDFVEKRFLVTHFKTILIPNKTISEKYGKEIKIFKEACKIFNKQGLMPDFFSGATPGHGSLAMRINGNSFLITARGSSKKNLYADEVVLVKKIDWRKKEIIVESVNNKKASLNAVLVAAIFEKFSNINVVIHTHTLINKAPTTDFPYTPGTLEYATKPLSLFKNNIRVINLKNHGLVAIGEDLKKTIDYVLR